MSYLLQAVPTGPNTKSSAHRPGDDSQVTLSLAKVISGGQTGVDRGALDAALELRFPCGGWCPPGRLAEDGCIPQRYPVQELSSGGYRKRTIKNLLGSDGTLLIHFGEPEGGTSLTLQQCIRKGKPYMLLDGDAVTAAEAGQVAADFVAENSIVTLNVAGPRLSRESRGYQYAYAVKIDLLRAAIDTRGARLTARRARIELACHQLSRARAHARNAKIPSPISPRRRNARWRST